MKVEFDIDMTDSQITEQIAENYAKRKLGLLPDEWFPLAALIYRFGRLDLFPSKE